MSTLDAVTPRSALYGLSEKNITELRGILASFPHIETAIIFGSRARGDYRRGSDIDLSLKGKDLTFTDIAWLDAKLEDSYIPYFFDTNIYSTLRNKELQANIDRDGKVIYKKEVHN